MSKIVREFTPCFIFRLPPGRHAHVASFATLGWLSFALLINPCFAIWIGAFSSSVWAPLNFVALPWGEHGRDLSRGKVNFGATCKIYDHFVVHFLATKRPKAITPSA